MKCKFSFEVPLKNIELQREISDYIFAIAPWFENATYRDFVLEHRADMPLYLDNGAYEQGASIDVKKFVELVRFLEPEVVIAPDVYGDGNGTIDLTRRFFSFELPRLTRVMIVPQGRSVSEWTECFQTLTSEFKDYFHIVGLPRIMYPNRLFLAEYSFELSGKPVHVLGCPDPSEVPPILNSSKILVESLDTSYPTRIALNKTGLSDRIDFLNDRVSPKALRDAVKQFFSMIGITKS